MAKVAGGDSGCGIQDAGYGMRDSGCGIRDSGCIRDERGWIQDNSLTRKYIAYMAMLSVIARLAAACLLLNCSLGLGAFSQPLRRASNAPPYFLKGRWLICTQLLL